MKILITGARGVLGTDLQPVFAENHELLLTDIDNMDIRDKSLVELTISNFKPDCVFHLAALTDVDLCEKEPESAYRTNAIGTKNIALACGSLNIELVYISTLSVFDGTKPTPYNEFDMPNPQSVYSKSKYHGELFVREFSHKHYIIRAGWMFGGGVEDKKFVAKIIQLAKERSELKVVDDKFGSPTYTVDFAQLIAHVVGNGNYGIYHGMNLGAPVSRYELAKFIVDTAGINGCRIVPISSAHFPLPAPRPRMEGGTSYLLEQKQRTWKTALEDYIQKHLNIVAK